MTLVLTTARRMAALGLCAAAVLATPFGTLPATAAASGAELYITVTPADGGAYAMHLTCDPDGGAHPRPVAACDVLRQVDGWIEDLNVDPGPCPLIYMPVNVDVTGHWSGREVSYHHVFPNSCVMERTLGPVV
ncbi:SSI family serine proteinase inhibitor [Nonomuraea basaltis]|uniref:SSI family serine proteinase inhibitor n=1 Tax=Nonomuraea basaltis TaxID=2495887 RepID=UPI001485CA5E|nr:SSI family serine proteinase inhibitor [Nonomuraea basaltis]